MNIQRDPKAEWCGVVMIIRPDVSKLSEGIEPTCRVVSKIDPELGDRRRIAETMPYALLAKFFKSDDGDAVEVYVEVSPPDSAGMRHLEFIERASKREFFLHVPQVTGPVPAH